MILGFGIGQLVNHKDDVHLSGKPSELESKNYSNASFVLLRDGCG
jgi:hypothetical protein